MNETMIVFVIPQFIPKGGQDLTSNPLLAQKVFFFGGGVQKTSGTTRPTTDAILHKLASSFYAWNLLGA